MTDWGPPTRSKALSMVAPNISQAQIVQISQAFEKHTWDSSISKVGDGIEYGGSAGY